MEFRLWIGLWTATFLMLIVMFNLSFLVKYITRFTEDCFATLVAIIFIIDAIKSTLSLRHLNEDVVMSMNENDTNFTNFTNFIMQMPSNRSDSEYLLKKAKQDSKFYFSVILFLLTFSVCSSLKGFRTKPYLPSKVI